VAGPLVFATLIRLSLMLRGLGGGKGDKSASGATAAGPAAPSKTTTSDEPPTFRILALGGSGSGKTVFLSSMFHELDHASPLRRYYLDTSAQERILLSEIYSTVSDTSKPFPKGTTRSAMRQFVFDCVAVDRATRVKAPVLRVSYLDYAGELLERSQEGGATAFDDLVAEINAADSLLGIIDGYRVWQLLRGIPAGETYFRNTLQPVFGFMARAACPIQFVLTKWDLVRNFGEPSDADEQDRLDRVIDALMEFEHFSALVNDDGRNQVVRLIPVSAVGSGFAQVVQGEVSKKPGATMRPYNVDAPFSAVLPDLFKQVEATLDTGTLKRLRDEARAAFQAHRLDAIAAALTRPAIRAAQTLLATAYGVTLGPRLTTTYMQWMAAPVEVTAADLEKQTDTTKRDLAQRQHLRALVMEDFDRTVLRLEAALPKSRLRGTW
jgi:hypothetical protein